MGNRDRIKQAKRRKLARVSVDDCKSADTLLSSV